MRLQKVFCVSVVFIHLQRGDNKTSVKVLRRDSIENENICTCDQSQLRLEFIKDGYNGWLCA